MHVLLIIIIIIINIVWADQRKLQGVSLKEGTIEWL